jgi:hypothetical protein
MLILTPQDRPGASQGPEQFVIDPSYHLVPITFYLEVLMYEIFCILLLSGTEN